MPGTLPVHRPGHLPVHRPGHLPVGDPDAAAVLALIGGGDDVVVENRTATMMAGAAGFVRGRAADALTGAAARLRAHTAPAPRLSRDDYGSFDEARVRLAVVLDDSYWRDGTANWHNARFSETLSAGETSFDFVWPDAFLRTGGAPGANTPAGDLYSTLPCDR
eukprot:gene6035-5436_t